VSITLLIVDDNEEVRFTLKEICTYAKWDVLEAATGKKAVELFKHMSPDLVLLDYHMPDWDGMHTTEEIRKINKNVPIIILTVDERQEIADSFLEAGATDFALKPIRAPDLISRIRIHIKMTKLSREKNSTTFVEKGINNATLLSIKQFLIQQKDACTLNEIQNNLPIAYQTVHRYLDYLVRNGEVKVIPQYGQKGRPKNKYKLLLDSFP